VAWLPTLVGAIVFFMDSPAIADSWIISLLADFCSHYSNIQNVGEHYAFPNAVRPFYAIIFSAFPFQTIFLWPRWRKYALPMDLTPLLRQSLWKRILVALLLHPMAILLCFTLFFIYDDQNICKGCTTDSKIALFLLVSLGAPTIQMLIFSSISILPHVREILFKISNR
jgi:hypothetical protein